MQESVNDTVVDSSHHPLHVFFHPRNIAVIGATEAPHSVGRALLWNLINNPFGGTVFPVNPKRQSVLGIAAYANIAEVPYRIDLAIIVTPASTVPDIIGECIAAGASGAIILSAGFREAGNEGGALEQEVLRRARDGRMRIIGPNCLGVMNPSRGLNASFAAAMARPGNVAFLTQSGALGTAILDWGQRELVGFSAFVSTGSMLDVGWGDLIQYFGDDERTRSIIIYMESIGDARSFLSAAREVALTKPIIVLKAGRTGLARKAAESHTGALSGNDEVLDAAFRRCGVLRVNSVSDLFYMSEVLSKQPRPRGGKLAIVTNAGGPGILAMDALLSDRGQLTDLSKETIDKLNEFLPPHWSHRNPVDILGDADHERYSKTIEVIARESEADGILAILTPQATTNPTLIAEHLKPFAKIPLKPILASWMGGADVAAGVAILNAAGIPTFSYPDAATRVFQYMWRYSYNLKGLYETPAMTDDDSADMPDSVGARDIIEGARKVGRTLLSESESKRILAAYRIPVVLTEIALTEDEAVAVAERIGYPVVVKLHSETVTHKSAVGGVHLNLPRDVAVRAAFRSTSSATPSVDFLGVTVQPMMPSQGSEIILGSSVDPQFGPVLLFGGGGALAEVFADRSLALPPLNTTLARRMMEQTKILAILEQRGVDLKVLDRLLVRFSRLVTEQRRIKEIDINPLLVSAGSLMAVDARVILHDANKDDRDLPCPAIRPYPSQYTWHWEARNGEHLTIRPIRPEDEPLLVEFHQHVSQQSVYFRYFHFMAYDQRVSHERLTRICFVDYDREIALVAERGAPAANDRAILGVGRLVQLHGTKDAEFAVLVNDLFQGQGLGTELLSRLVEIGRAENLNRIVADILGDNGAMQRVAKRVGFHLRTVPGESLIKAELPLRGPIVT